jgi:putative CocE/NonD family hydrolase
MRKNGESKLARRNQKLLIGPWGHTADFVRHVGVVDFGVEAEVDFIDLLVRWFDYWLKGIDNGVMDEPPIKLFVMGENEWRFEDDWPLERTVYTDYYFHSSGEANSPLGDGSLRRTPPGDEPPDRYVYDPKDPVMSLCNPDYQDAPYDQRPLDRRRDVLVYATEPLQDDIEVTGPVVVKLWAASTALDTDFTAKLVDVHPDGFAVPVCHGILRTSYRDGFDNPQLITPGEVYEYTIPLRETGNLFKKGHRIRVDIASSDFPFFDRNHNTGRPFYEDSELVAASQTVYHNSAHPSRVILPVIPR